MPSKVMINKENFYSEKQEPNRSCLLAMRSILLKYDDDITETQKYGMPCFLYKRKAFCYLWVDKKTKEPYFLLVEGNRLHHPDLEAGDRSRMKIFRVDPNKDLPLSQIDLIMKEALELCGKGKS